METFITQKSYTSAIQIWHLKNIMHYYVSSKSSTGQSHLDCGLESQEFQADLLRTYYRYSESLASDGRTKSKLNVTEITMKALVKPISIKNSILQIHWYEKPYVQFPEYYVRLFQKHTDFISYEKPFKQTWKFVNSKKHTSIVIFFQQKSDSHFFTSFHVSDVIRMSYKTYSR